MRITLNIDSNNYDDITGAIELLTRLIKIPPPKVDQERLDGFSIAELELSVRTTNTLASNDIHTLGDLRTFLSQGGRINTIKGLGRRSLIELRETLSSVGFVREPTELPHA